MTVLFKFVYVFVGKIDSARKGDLAVDGNDLSVVAVVLLGSQKRTEGIEHGTFYAEFLHLLGIILGERNEATEIVVDQPNLNTLGNFTLENFQNAVPHLAFLHDKILKENIFFGFFKLNEKLLEFCLARRQIFGLRIPVNGKARKILQIPHLRRVFGKLTHSVLIAVAGER